MASRYPNKLTTLYRLNIMMANKMVDQRYYRLKLHIMMVIKYYVYGPTIPRLSSGNIKQVCGSIEKFMSAGSDNTLSNINRLIIFVRQLSIILTPLLVTD
jgi:hypothetical protein